MAVMDPDADTKLTLFRSIPTMIETAVLVLLLALFTEALLGPLLTDETQPEGPRVLRLMWLPVYAVIFVLAIPHIPKLAVLVFRMPFIIGLMVLIGASVFWSIDTELTLRRFFAIGFTTAFGLYLAVRYDWRDMLALFGIVWLLLALASVVASLGVPSFGVEQEEHAGAWRGIWFQKNDFGGHMARASFLFAFLTITQRHLRKLWIFALALAVLLVLLSTSKTSLLGMLLGFGVLGFGMIVRRGPVPMLSMVWTGVTFGSALLIFIVTQPALALELIGRDPTLTGRTDIWVALGDVIADRPLLGYGYGAFWGEGSVPAEYVRGETEWAVPTAHNGWLETWLSIGLVGLVFFALSLTGTLARAVRAAFAGWYGFFALGLMLQFLVFSISESNILQHNGITWIAYVAVAGALVPQRQSIWDSSILPRRNRDFLLPN